jgi:hypothetical protein
VLPCPDQTDATTSHRQRIHRRSISVLFHDYQPRADVEFNDESSTRADISDLSDDAVGNALCRGRFIARLDHEDLLGADGHDLIHPD